MHGVGGQPVEGEVLFLLRASMKRHKYPVLMDANNGLLPSELTKALI